MTPTRRAVALAGVATLAFSLLISIAPALAGNGNGNGNNGNNPSSSGSSGNGNGGTIKVHDASTGQEAVEQNNEPTVCSFWVGFYTSGGFEAGTWELLSWEPTGDGSVVASGTYDTTGDGVDTTGTLSPAAGHYRFEWRAAADANAKHKMLWVDAGCGTQSQAESPTEESSPTQESSPSQAESPTEESSPSQAESPTEESSPSQAESPTEESSPSEETSPSQESSPSQQEVPSDDPRPTDPEQQVEHGNPGSGNVDPAAAEQPVAGVEPTLPDTAVPVGESGLLATIGLLLIVAAHAGTRRERNVPSA